MNLLQYILVGLLLTSSSNLIAQHTYRIQGHITSDKNPEWADLYIYQNGLQKIDSAQITNGQFVLEGEISHPQPASIRVRQVRRSQDIILEPAQYLVYMNEDWQQPQQAYGGIENSIRKAYEYDVKALQDSMMTISKGYDTATEEEKVSIGDQLQELNDQVYAIKKGYIQAYPHSVAVIEMMRPHFSVMNYKELSEMKDSFSSSLSHLSSYHELIKNYELKKSQFIVGYTAPDILSTTVSGESFDLSGLRGKLVLLDFWASWCAPCRAANQKLIPIYEQYKDEGFEIVSFSMDTKEKLWKDAIAKDGIPWIQVSDLTDLKESSVARDYSVSQLPTIYLIDEQGEVIAQNISTQELQKLLNERYKR